MTGSRGWGLLVVTRREAEATSVLLLLEAWYPTPDAEMMMCTEALPLLVSSELLQVSALATGMTRASAYTARHDLKGEWNTWARQRPHQ